MKFLNIDNLLRIDIWKVDVGYVYIHNNLILWKKDEKLMPNSKTDIPSIEIIKSINFKKIDKISLEGWEDWWVWRFLFKEEINNIDDIVAEDFGYTDEFAKKINYNSVKYETDGISIDKSENNKLIFKYSKKNSYKAYRLIRGYLLNTNNDIIGLNTENNIKDKIEFYIFIRSVGRVEITLVTEDYKSLKNFRIYYYNKVEN